jgi:hypothetical protein
MAQEPNTSFQPNFLDKMVWALTKLDEMSRPAIYVTKLFLAIALGLNLGVFYRFLAHRNVINLVPMDQYWVPLWVQGVIFFGACYIPVHLATHSAVEIQELDLSGRERWAYTILGLFIAVSWGITGILFL